MSHDPRADVGALLPPASSADIVRAALKDEEFISSLFVQADSLARDVLPNGVLSSAPFSTSLSALIRGLYYFLSLGREPRRTPGDEYVAVLPVRNTRTSLAPASPLAVVLLATMHALGRPFAVACLRVLWRRLTRLVARLLHSDSPGHLPPFPSHSIDATLYFFERVHLAAFYIGGVYYYIPNRLLRLRYVRTAAPALHTEVAVNRYQFLGVLVAIQLCGVALASSRTAFAMTHRHERSSGGSLVKIWGRHILSGLCTLVYPAGSDRGEQDGDMGTESDDSGIEDSTHTELSAESRIQLNQRMEDRSTEASALTGRRMRSRRRKCPLCLGVLKSATLTSCGHVFCWGCVTNWCATHEVCPICRTQILMHKDLFLLSNH